MLGEEITDARTGLVYVVVKDFAHRDRNEDLLNPVGARRRSVREAEAEAHIDMQSKPRPPGSGRRVRPKNVES